MVTLRETVTEFANRLAERYGLELRKLPIVEVPARGRTLIAHHTGMVVVSDEVGELGLVDFVGEVAAAIAAFRRARASAYEAAGRMARHEDLSGSFVAASLYGEAERLDREWGGMLSAAPA
jgi:hypothetical protein